MSQKIYSILMVALLVWSGNIGAALEILEHGFELGIDEVTLPRHTGGNVVIQQCEDCERQAYQVDGRTVYRIGTQGQAVSLQEFRQAVAMDQGEMFLVSVSTSTGKVTKVTLDLLKKVRRSLEG